MVMTIHRSRRADVSVIRPAGMGRHGLFSLSSSTAIAEPWLLSTKKSRCSQIQPTVCGTRVSRVEIGVLALVNTRAKRLCGYRMFFRSENVKRWSVFRWYLKLSSGVEDPSAANVEHEGLGMSVDVKVGGIEGRRCCRMRAKAEVAVGATRNISTLRILEERWSRCGDKVDSVFDVALLLCWIYCKHHEQQASLALYAQRHRQTWPSPEDGGIPEYHVNVTMKCSTDVNVALRM